VLWLKARNSRGQKGHGQKFSGCFAVLELLRNHAQGQSLDFRHGLVAIASVAHHAWQRWHLRGPATVGLAFQLNGEGHKVNLALNQPPNKRLQPTAAGAMMSRRG
jgi:hypothetical protein